MSLRAALLLCCAASAASAQSGGLRIAQQDRVEGSGADVRLADVAVADAADAADAAALRRVVVATLAGSTLPFAVGRERLVEAVRAAGFDPAAIAWSGPTTTRVEIRPVVLAGPQAVDLAKRRVADALGADGTNASFGPTAPPSDLAVPPGRHKTRFEARLPAQGRLAGPVRVAVVALVDEVETATVEVLLDVRRRGPVVVAKKELRPGATVGLDDVEVLVRDLAPLPAETLSAAETAVGSVVARRVVPGVPLAVHDLKARPVVRKGDEVALRYAVGPLTVTAAGRALADAAPGERVEVLHLANKRRVEGRVVDARTVDVAPASPESRR
jgi:flagella basal body P-ring formation protein FlgA